MLLRGPFFDIVKDVSFNAKLRSFERIDDFERIVNFVINFLSFLFFSFLKLNRNESLKLWLPGAGIKKIINSSCR